MATPKKVVYKADRTVDIRLYDPFLRPDWRYERVLRMVDKTPVPGRTTKRDDKFIRAMRSFVLRWRTGDEIVREELRYENPGLFYAYKIYDRLTTDPEVEFMIQARLLAGQPIDEIAYAVKTLPETIEWYEAMFFNVTPFLKHHDWIVKQVLMPAMDRQPSEESKEEELDDVPLDLNHSTWDNSSVCEPYLDSTLKFFAYFGGPILCEYMISGFKKGVMVHSKDDIDGWLDAQWGTAVRRRSAQVAGVFSISKFDVADLFATHARIVELSRSKDNEEERRSTIERHIHVMMSELPWSTGSDGKMLYDETDIGKYDNSEFELRDDELMLVAAGEAINQKDPNSIEAVISRLCVPDEQEERKDAKPNDG